MYADITNAGTEEIYIPGPEISIPVGETKRWPDVTVHDLDANDVIKAGVVAGTLTVDMVPEANEAAEATIGSLMAAALPKFAYADLPTGFNGRVVFCTDGRKTGEGGGAGTGVPAYWTDSDSDWHVFYDDSVLAI